MTSAEAFLYGKCRYDGYGTEDHTEWTHNGMVRNLRVLCPPRHGLVGAAVAPRRDPALGHNQFTATLASGYTLGHNSSEGHPGPGPPPRHQLPD
ncbi:hypothetical protein CROQUDRAFT_85898 [Cronartium quercuum f. sp. fusiforme G11]|uniref:Uncharacterized protein n=1 Tax=Cronartium quercuum f. sp. fusiforme G11 TaxID=708437 RepID=A0A9P6TH65_9BASI|nr:hypothetical protein CROQUDRAFT_85898 [Cronartium quercuum f. sp. fusiforme G11]